jgi:hypothetical protein
VPLKNKGGVMNYPDFEQRELVNKMTASELMQLANLKEMRRSLEAVVSYMQQEEEAVFKAARERENNVKS